MLVRTLEKLQVHLTVVPCQKKGTLTEFHDTVYRLTWVGSKALAQSEEKEKKS